MEVKECRTTDAIGETLTRLENVTNLRRNTCYCLEIS